MGFDAEHMPSDAKQQTNFKDYVQAPTTTRRRRRNGATEICGTPVEDITWYAEMAGKNNAVMFLHSYAASRYLGARTSPSLHDGVGFRRALRQERPRLGGHLHLGCG